MILKRHIAYVLLSLLLVLSQQLGMTHAISHLSDLSQQGSQPGSQQLSQQAGAERDNSPSKNRALDQRCDQCLVFAQGANALATPSFTFPAAEHAAPLGAVADTPLACQRTVCVFQSRAPPQHA